MDTATDDPLDQVCRSLERIGALKNQQLLSESEYEDLKALLVVAMKTKLTLNSDTAASQSSPRQSAETVPFGALHKQAVERIVASYEAGNTTIKQRILGAMAVMAEKRVFLPGDYEEVTALVDVLIRPENWPDDPVLMNSNVPGAGSGEGVRRLLQMLADLNDAAAQILSRSESGATAKAIAGTAQESGTRAAADVAKPQPSGTTTRTLWRKLVLSDVEGAFQGGAAAAAIAPAFGPLMPAALPVAAALGVVVGAGIRSGLARVGP
jgi:hypothetical protein